MNFSGKARRMRWWCLIALPLHQTGGWVSLLAQLLTQTTFYYVIFLTGTPLKITSFVSVSKFWHVFDGIYYVIWHLELLEGSQLKKSPCKSLTWISRQSREDEVVVIDSPSPPSNRWLSFLVCTIANSNHILLQMTNPCSIMSSSLWFQRAITFSSPPSSSQARICSGCPPRKLWDVACRVSIFIISTKNSILISC